MNNSLTQNFARLRQQAKMLRGEEEWSSPANAQNWQNLAKFFSQHNGEFLPIDLLLMKSAAIQLSDDDADYCLEDAEKALLQALELNQNDIQTKVDLAYFYYAVMDDAVAALPLFTSAVELAKFSLEEAICGQAEALRETEGLEAAIACLQQSALKTEAIQELWDGFLEEKGE